MKGTIFPTLLTRGVYYLTSLQGTIFIIYKEFKEN